MISRPPLPAASCEQLRVSSALAVREVLRRLADSSAVDRRSQIEHISPVARPPAIFALASAGMRSAAPSDCSYYHNNVLFQVALECLEHGSFRLRNLN